MTLLDKPRGRIFVASVAFLGAAILCVLCAHRLLTVHAAKQSIVTEDAPTFQQSAADSTSHHGTPVLVELFTSEGCSSCPPADDLLARLDRDQPVPTADIVTLGEHVDYWDSLGWHDRFSSPQLTARQSAYTQRLQLDDNYTPQMIVDGLQQFVGNDTSHALRAIAGAAQTSKLELTLSTITYDGAHLLGSVSCAPRPGSLPGGDIYAAVVQSTATTQVRSGENGGRTLHHASVVRTLQRIGSLSDLAAKPLAFSLSTPRDAPIAAFRVVVFAQRSGQGAILAAVSSAESSAPHPASVTVAAQSPESLSLRDHLK
jgi:hypothetical protein